LYGLSNLTEVWFINTQINNKEMRAFQQTHPKCKIKL